jgi:hypothetical protein
LRLAGSYAPCSTIHGMVVVVSVVQFVLFWFCSPMHTQSFDTIQCVRGTCHSGDYEKVVPAGWLPSIPERMLPLFRVRRDKAGTALSLLGPISISSKNLVCQSQPLLSPSSLAPSSLPPRSASNQPTAAPLIAECCLWPWLCCLPLLTPASSLMQ